MPPNERPEYACTCAVQAAITQREGASRPLGLARLLELRSMPSGRDMARQLEYWATSVLVRLMAGHIVAMERQEAESFRPVARVRAAGVLYELARRYQLQRLQAKQAPDASWPSARST